jgi:hypothetical protein
MRILRPIEPFHFSLIPAIQQYSNRAPPNESLQFHLTVLSSALYLVYTITEIK